jgi:hypothetical protein
VLGLLITSVRTPAARACYARWEARTLAVALEDRILVVRREARVLAPAAESRILVVPEESRSIDA